MNADNKIARLPSALASRILEELSRLPGQKVADISSALGADRKEILDCLTKDLAGKVTQDASYRWRILVTGAQGLKASAEKAAPRSEIGKLARYYLECVGQDSDEGVNTFAASFRGDPDYAELPALPTTNTTWDWWNAPGAQRILGKVKADKANLTAWLGYPVRLRKHKTAKWEGFFVEPVLLWQVEIPERAGDGYRLVDDLPTPNFAFLRSLALGDPSAIVEEAALLDEDLGLNSPLDDRPEVDELLQRLASIRPDWDWQEELDPEHCSAKEPLSAINKAGIYNRAVILPGKRSPFTQGLEAELKQLSEMDDTALSGTALGQWLTGVFSPGASSDAESLLEVLPMNSEQRAAVRSALTEPITVVTGPPGTGKSQVVTNLLVNAAWRGMKVLFASKNNKAVDVVETRVNGLGNRPVLLRLGSKEYQAKLGSYLTAMLSGNVSPDDIASYKEGLERHRHLANRLLQLDELRQKTLDIRNHADRLSAAAEDYRSLFGEDRFNALDQTLVAETHAAIQAYLLAVDILDDSEKGFLSRMVGKLLRKSRLEALTKESNWLSPYAAHLGMTLPDVGHDPNLSVMRRSAKDLLFRLGAANKVLAYQSAVDQLQASPAFENIAKQHQQLTEQIAKNSAGLWRDWVQQTPSRLTAAQRKEIADYAAVLQLVTGPNSQNLPKTVWGKAKSLQQSVTALFSCWAVTSLSARGKIPFSAGYFDLVVIDEASQCDIASVLPLLYRAKRAVIIGDPMQLKHISAVTSLREGELQRKYGLMDLRASWMYSVNSLYDVAASVANSSDLICLRDHHRSHADIIGFSNRHFYDGNLRVATKYNKLKRPRNKEPGIVWQNVRGKATRAEGGGLFNSEEVTAIIEAIHDLLVVRGYPGTIGVVTPFRAQAQLIQRRLIERTDLTAAVARAEMLVDTVHKFQGDERDVMFFSPVISPQTPPGALAFLRGNGNLFNVAITRARGLLHVVGDQTAAKECGVGYLADFASYVSRLTVQPEVTNGPRESEFGPEYPVVANPEQVSEWEIVFYKALYKAGIRVVPQFAVEQYVLDFALFIGDKRLDIEVDGEKYHRSWTGELCLRDQLRNQRLIELGWEVKRFWVYELRDRLPECIKKIQEWIASEGA